MKLPFFKSNKGNTRQSLSKSIKNIFGFSPGNIFVYELAFLHKSVKLERDGHRLSNERLEFLGDAVLDLAVADFLFRKYPYKDEGFLTEIRSRLVSRSHLNRLSEKLGIDKLIVTECDISNSSKSFKGNAFEAFIGAVFIDKGFNFASHIIVHRILALHVDIDDILNNDTNFKSRLVEWCQKNKHSFEFVIRDSSISKRRKFYSVDLLIDGAMISSAEDYSVKGAEQIAAGKGLDELQKLNNDVHLEQKEMI